MSGPYLPDHGTVPSEVTVTRDGDHVVVCGVRLTEEQARPVAGLLNGHLLNIKHERETAKRQAEALRRRREWLAGAVAVAELPSGDPVRLLPDGRIETAGPVWYRDLRPTLALMLAACPTPRRLWWVGSRKMLHMDGCGCNINKSLSDARLLPVEEVPAKVCKRTARKLAAEVTP